MKTENHYHGPHLTRAQARDLGHEFYLAGETCPHGHSTPKFVGAKQCRGCRQAKSKDAIHRQRCKDWEKKNPKYYSEYAKANLEHRSQTQKARVEAMPPDARVKERKGRCRITSRYRHRHPERIRATEQKRRALVMGADGFFTESDISEIRRFQGGQCSYFDYCGNDLAGEHRDHVIALINGGTNWPFNIQLTCPPCNLRKGRKDPLVFLAELRAEKEAA